MFRERHKSLKTNYLRAFRLFRQETGKVREREAKRYPKTPKNRDLGAQGRSRRRREGEGKARGRRREAKGGEGKAKGGEGRRREGEGRRKGGERGASDAGDRERRRGGGGRFTGP